MADKYKVGGYYLFGNYMQGDSATEKTPIEWEILDVADGEITLISRYILDIFKEFHPIAYSNLKEQPDKYPFLEEPVEPDKEFNVSEWLNGYFKDMAFSEEEKSLLRGEIDILSVKDIGRYYKDRVYPITNHDKCESCEFVYGYFGPKLIGIPTDYALKRGLCTHHPGINPKVWEQEDYLWGEYNHVHEGWEWEKQFREEDIVKDPTYIWMLKDHCYVDVNADTICSNCFDDYFDHFVWGCEEIAGLRPVIRILPAD